MVYIAKKQDLVILELVKRFVAIMMIFIRVCAMQAVETVSPINSRFQKEMDRKAARTRNIKCMLACLIHLAGIMITKEQGMQIFLSMNK